MTREDFSGLCCRVNYVLTFSVYEVCPMLPENSAQRAIAKSLNFMVRLEGGWITSLQFSRIQTLIGTLASTLNYKILPSRLTVSSSNIISMMSSSGSLEFVSNISFSFLLRYSGACANTTSLSYLRIPTTFV
jgi:hypothetical protein